MNPSYRIRRCKDGSDAEAIHKLVTELATFEKQPAAVTQTVEDYRRDGFDVEHPLFYASLLEHHIETGWVPVGLAVWYFSYSTWKGKSFYLEDLYIKPEHRGKGQGKHLLSYCIKEAHEEKCARMEWTVLNWNKKAINLYKSIGAEFPDDDVWKLMRMDQTAIAEYIKASEETA